MGLFLLISVRLRVPHGKRYLFSGASAGPGCLGNSATTANAVATPNAYDKAKAHSPCCPAVTTGDSAVAVAVTREWTHLIHAVICQATMTKGETKITIHAPAQIPSNAKGAKTRVAMNTMPALMTSSGETSCLGSGDGDVHSPAAAATTTNNRMTLCPLVLIFLYHLKNNTTGMTETPVFEVAEGDADGFADVLNRVRTTPIPTYPGLSSLTKLTLQTCEWEVRNKPAATHKDDKEPRWQAVLNYYWFSTRTQKDATRAWQETARVIRLFYAGEELKSMFHATIGQNLECMPPAWQLRQPDAVLLFALECAVDMWPPTERGDMTKRCQRDLLAKDAFHKTTLAQHLTNIALAWCRDIE